MRKNKYNNHIFKYSKHTKNTRPKSTSLSKNMPINKPQNEKNEIPIIDLLKCPICKKICLININRDQLLFSFECNNNHSKNLQKSNTFQQEDKNISDLNISQDNLKDLNKGNSQNNNANTNTNNKVYITEKDFYCEIHPNSKYQSYCLECRANICNECLNQHLNHNQIELNILKPKENEVTLYKNDIKKKDEELNNLIENIMKWQKQFEYGLNTIIRIMQNISNLRQFIIMNYDTNQSNQNYNYIQNFNNMKVLNFIFPELEEFLKEPEWKQKGHILIEIIVDIQNKIIKNKEKLEIIKIQKEAEKLKENLIKQEKILKSKKNEKNLDEKEDLESAATDHSNKKKKFNTTFISDCINNIYFSSFSSKQKRTKKKNIEKRNKNRKNNTLTHTIEQNKELEKNLNKENESENNNKNKELNLDPKKIKRVESVNNNRKNNNNENNLEELKNSQNHNNINYYSLDKIDNNKKNDENYNINEEKDYGHINEINIKTSEIDKNNINKKCNDNNYFEYNEKEKSININISNNVNNNSNNNINNSNINNNNNISDINNNNIYKNYTKDDNNEINNINNSINNIDNSDNKEKSNIEEKVQNLDNVEGKINNEENNKNGEILKNKKQLLQKNIYTNIDLKYELINTDIIRSIEFINKNLIIICTLENIAIYKMNSNYELIKEFDIKEFNYRINYATQLSNGDLIICSLNYMNIIRLSQNQTSLSYNLVQKLNGKNDSYNINKVIELKNNNYLISCDNNYLIIYSKNKETNLYEEYNFINLDSEVKCLEPINEKMFVTVEPEKENVIFYDIEKKENNYFVINNIQSAFGRYVISYLSHYNCIFITGRQGIYLISTEKYQLITFFKIDEWISSINYDYYNDYLICGTWKKNSINEQKIYNLIIFEINDNLKKKSLDNMNIREVMRKNNVHYHDIVVIKPSEEGLILTGSYDKTVKLWKYN